MVLRVDRNSSIFNVRLRSYPVKLVFNQELSGHGAGDIGQVSSRRRQHEFDWMKQTHADVSQICRSCPDCSLANVTEKHVGVGDVVK